MSKQNTSILDNLIQQIEEEPMSMEENIPFTCLKCKNNFICSPLMTFISFAKYGILIDIKKCIYKPNQKD